MLYKMATMEESKDDSEISLREMFDKALRNYDLIKNGNVEQLKEQSLIKSTIATLEDCTRLINTGQIFSSNEMLEEVPTDCVHYLAIPAMLGELVGRVTSQDRVAVLDISEIYYKDFLKRVKEYGFFPEELDPHPDGGQDRSLASMMRGRNEMVRKFEEQKRIESDLVQLRKYLEADEEKRREYYILFVKSFIFKAEEELRSIQMEKPLAERRKKEGISEKPKKFQAPPSRPLQAVIITKNDLQKKVYGAGYPSLPTLTVDEFYAQRVKEGIFPANPGMSLQGMEDPEEKKRMEEKEEAEKEIAVENDDPEALEQARGMDDFKDEHRRGYGNRYNRS